jgi:uncharacterized membrane protein YgcG
VLLASLCSESLLPSASRLAPLCFIRTHRSERRYNTPAAAMYRDIIIALRDGKAPPTDIAPYEAELAAESAAKASDAAAHVGESAAERDARLRAEASERMKAKFGAGGLKSQALGSGGGGGSSMSSLSGGPSSSSGGGGGASLDDFFGVDFAAQ